MGERINKSNLPYSCHQFNPYRFTLKPRNKRCKMDQIVDFLKLLNDKIPPIKEKNYLIRPHSINYINAETIEVNLRPLSGGSYHIPVKVIGKTAQEVVGKVRELYDRTLRMV